MYGSGNEPFNSRVLAINQFDLQYQNRAREILDLLFNAEQTGMLIDEQAKFVWTSGQQSMVDADRAMWDYHPVLISANVNASKAGHGRFYESSATNDYVGMQQHMKNYIATRTTFLNNNALTDSNYPSKPTITYTGPASFPLDQLSFSSSSFSDPQGGGSFGAMKWRIAEVTNLSNPIYDPLDPYLYEINPVWESAEITTFNSNIVIPTQGLSSGRSYRVRVRHKDNTERWGHWSDAVEFIASQPGSFVELAAHLRISEMNFNPSAGSQFEYIELFNASTTTTIEFNGEAFTDGIDYVISGGTQILPQGYLLVVQDTSAGFADFRAEYNLGAGIPIVGPYAGSLNNAGERVELSRTLDGQKLFAFDYSDARGWWLEADGPGHSLVPLSINVQPGDSLNYGRNWRPGTFMKGSPGSVAPAAIDEVVLTEVAPHTDTGNPAPADSNDWVEVLNRSAGLVALTDWYLSDDKDDLTKYELGNGFANISAGGRLVFTETLHFNNPAGSGFGINKKGEPVYLSHLPSGSPSQHRVADVARFKGVESEAVPFLMSWGRTPENSQWWTNTVPSQGAANNVRKADVHIEELMYHPASEFDLEQYIKLLNPTNGTINLFHATEGTWRIDGGVSFTFPGGTSLVAGESLLIVGFDPTNTTDRANFEAQYGAISGQIVGPYTGRLSNQGERIALERPQPEDQIGEGVSWVIVDEVIYFDQAPWSSSADGTGLALHRNEKNESGNDWNNWTPQTPNPNPASPSPPTVSISSAMVVNGGQVGFYSADFTVTFSRGMTGFSEGDLSLANGVVKNGSFAGSGGDSVYTFTMIATTPGIISVQVPASVANAADTLQGNTASSIFSYELVIIEDPMLTGDFWLWVNQEQ